MPKVEECFGTPIVELPEEIMVTEVFTKEGPKKSTIKKRVLKKRKGSTEERTEIITEEVEGKKPKTSVIIQEIEIPEQELELQTPVVTEIFPEEIKIINELGPEEPKKKVVKRKL